jgi:hypothetical protein
MEIYVHGEVPRIWNHYIITGNDLIEHFPSARYRPEYINCVVWWVNDPDERTLAILKYS